MILNVSCPMKAAIGKDRILTKAIIFCTFCNDERCKMKATAKANMNRGVSGRVRIIMEKVNPNKRIFFGFEESAKNFGRKNKLNANKSINKGCSRPPIAQTAIGAENA